MKDLALLIIDLQDSYLKVIPQRDELLKRCSFALEAAMLLGIKVLYTEQAPEKLNGTNKFLIERGLNNAQHFSKTSFSAFGAEGFLDYLHQHELNHLLIAGVETSICVYQTIIDAIRHDFDVTMLSDCVAGRRDADSLAIIAALQNSNCHRLPSETVFYSLLQNADNPNFRQFNDLVKKYG